MSRQYWRRWKWNMGRHRGWTEVFLYDELEMNDELYVERADRASRREGVKITAITLIKQFLLSY